MSFHVGQKVVCVNARPHAGTIWFDGEALTAGGEYTVRRYFLREGEPTLWLDEVARTTKSQEFHGDEVGYAAFRFRPLIERKTDISALTALLNPKNHKVLEGV